MRNLLLLLTTLITFTLYSQNQKVYVFKAYKNGKVIGQKVVLVKVKGPTLPVVVKTKTKTLVKTVTKTVEVPVIKVETKTVEDTKKIDSLNALIGKYETVNKKTDVIKLKDNLGTVTVNDEIVGNQFVNRTFSADIKPVTKERIVEVYRPKTVQWFLGPSVTTRVSNPLNQPLQSINLSLLRKGLDDNMFQFSVGGTIREGYMEPKPILGIGYLIKIK